MERSCVGPLPEVVLDEIALEGLYGITLEALWTRLSIALKLELPLKESFKKNVWTFILKSTTVLSFYELPESRPKLQIFDRLKYFENMHEYQNEISESSSVIYKWKPIEKDNVRGSCEFYNERKTISINDLKDLTVKDVEIKWGNKFVIVGSQSLREKSLFPSNIEKPELSLINYCILEIIGRSRYNGEKTGGKNSLLSYIKDSSTISYSRNTLENENLITRQVIKDLIYCRLQLTNILHLRRFFVEIKLKNLELIELLCNELKKQPNFALPSVEMKNRLPKEFQFLYKKSLYTEEFRKYFNYNKMLYRQVYPDATDNEWKFKNGNEREIMAIQLKNNQIDLNDVQHKENELITLNKEISNSNNDDNLNKDSRNGYANVNYRYLDMPLCNQIYKIVDKYGGVEGYSQVEINNYLGINRYQMRKYLRDMCTIKLLTSYMVDRGKSKTILYVTNKNAKCCAEKNLIPSTDDLLKTLKTNANEKENSSNKIHKEIKNEIEDNLEKDKTSSVSSIPILHSSKVEENEKTVTCSEFFDNLDLLPSTSGIENNSTETTDETSETEVHRLMNSYVTEKVRIKNNEITKNFPSMNVKIMRIERKSNIDPKAPVTQRQIKRANFIVNTINEKLILDLTQMHRTIKHYEKEMGYKDKCCKKSLIRTINWLTKNQIIKLFEIIFKLNEYAKIEKFLCHKSITIDSQKLNEEIKRIGDPFYVYVSEKYLNLKLNESAVQQQQLHHHHHHEQNQIKSYKKAARFVRARHFHELLFYLIYDQNRSSSNAIELNDEVKNTWTEIYPDINVTEIENILPNLYSKNIDFKMFISPLPLYEHPNGWAKIEDILFRIPFSIAMQMFHIEEETSKNDELQKYLKHPILQHIPISLLPINIHSILKSSKLLNYYAHEDTMKVLNIMGLVQMNHKMILETKKQWIYLNRHTMLLDTSISDEGYDQITKDKNYDEFRFTFRTFNDVQNYWDTLYQICLVTKLGLKAHPSTRIKSEENKNCKKKHIELPDLPTVDFDEAIENDRGQLPADKLGAAGLDSSLFAHIRKNWVKIYQNVSNKQKPLQVKIKLPLSQISYKVMTKDRKIATIKKKSTMDVFSSSSSSLRRKTKFGLQTIKKASTGKSGAKKVIPKSSDKKRIRKREYDEVDIQALKKIQKLRTSWTPEEDVILLYCRTVLTYWQHPYLNRVINSFTIRDILHWSLNISQDKTSIACQRRLVTLTKTAKAKTDISSWVFELKQSKFIQQRFGENFLHDLRKVYADDLEYCTALRIYFVQMIYYLRRILKNGSILNYNQCVILPSTLNQFKKFYKEIIPAIKQDDKNIKYNEPNTIDDIEILTINLIIHSSMCCSKDKTLYNVQLFDIYKGYKEDILNKSFKHSRDNQLIIQCKKRYVSTESSSTFCLSHKYKTQLYLSIPYASYDEYYQHITDTFDKLFFKKNNEEQQNYIELSSINSGGVFYLSDLLNRSNIQLDIQIPKKILTIDPQQSSFGESEMILDHFRKMFENAPKIDYSKILENSSYDDDGDLNENNSMSSVQQHQIKRKIKFNFVDDTYLLAYNPYDIVLKLNNVYLHFYCGLQNLNKSLLINIQNFSCDQCPFNVHNCVLNNENYLNLIETIIQDNKDVINILARNNDDDDENAVDADDNKNLKSDLLSTRKILITTENLLQIFSKFYNSYKSQMVKYDKKDIGEKLLMKNCNNIIDMITLTKDLLEYYANNEINGIGNLNSNNTKSYESYEVTLNKEEKIFRMQDVFVVNIPKLRITYSGDAEESIKKLGNLQIPSYLEDFCNRFEEILEKIKRDAIWPKHGTNTNDFETEYKNNKSIPDDEKKFTENLLQFIKESPLGATSTVLREKFIDELKLTKSMDILRKYNFVMRVGVEEWRYVHKDHIRPWIIHSYHIKRLEKESTDPKTTHKDFLHKFEKSKRKRHSNIDEDIEPKEKKLKLKENDNDDEGSKEDQSELSDQNLKEPEPCCSTSLDHDSNKRSKRIKKPVDRYTDTNDTKSELNSTNREIITLRPSPWIRVNGSLNRRVLDKWLGSILLECLIKCGIIVKNLFTRFNYLHPVCILYLLEILQKLDCIEMKKYEKKNLTIFSTYEENEECDATEFSNLNHVFILVKPYAINNLTLFIGEKKYKTDFI